MTFGQSYAGNYRAIFFNIFSEPKTVIAEFEVKSDNSIAALVKFGELKNLKGKVDKKGKFEAVSVAEGNTVYKLKGKFDKNNKISFIQRIENRSSGNKSVSENALEGTFSKVVKPAQIVEPPISADLVDNGKSWLKIQHSSLFFGNEWTTFKARIIGKMNGNTDSWEIQVLSTYTDGEQKVTILFPKFSGNTKVWKSDYFDLINYVERKTNVGRNSFVAYPDIYKQNPQLAGGTLELVKETETQMIFKVSKLKIKRVIKPDFVELNGFIYADKAN
jgi:hypothetical protein